MAGCDSLLINAISLTLTSLDAISGCRLEQSLSRNLLGAEATFSNIFVTVSMSRSVDIRICSSIVVVPVPPRLRTRGCFHCLRPIKYVGKVVKNRVRYNRSKVVCMFYPDGLKYSALVPDSFPNLVMARAAYPFYPVADLS